MKEPCFIWEDGTLVPFSQAKVEDLKRIAEIPSENGDREFQLRYAAIVLKEKGG